MILRSGIHEGYTKTKELLLPKGYAVNKLTLWAHKLVFDVSVLLLLWLKSLNHIRT